MADAIFTFAINIGRDILTALLVWYQAVYEATGMTGLWIGVVALSIVFSVVLVPLRGGRDLTRGAFGSFAMNRINNHDRTE